MRETVEILLRNKNVGAEDWVQLIKQITNLNGYFTTWELIVTIKENRFSFFIKNKRTIPYTINHLNSFLFREKKFVENIPFVKSYGIIKKTNYNLIDLMEEMSIKNKGEIKRVDIQICKRRKRRYRYRTFLYVLKNNKVMKKRLFFSNPATLLSINFDQNKRYIYAGAFKYIDCNKVLPYLEEKKKNAILQIDGFPYTQKEHFLDLSSYDFCKHSMIMGASGSGKSKFMSQFISSILGYKKKLSCKIVVIDPHAALEKDIGRYAHIVDFMENTSSIDLFQSNGENTIVETELLLDLFKSLLPNYNAKLERVLRYSIHILLVDQNFNFVSLRKLLLEVEVRSNLIKTYEDILPESVITFFLNDFNDIKTKSYTEAISPIISFIDEMVLLPVFNETRYAKNLYETMQENDLILFSLDRTYLGDNITKTISGLIMQQLFKCIQTYSFKEPILFFIDEVALVENPILMRFLSEARKYNLALIVAGQYFNQISDSVKKAIFANVINYYILRLSREDARDIVPKLNIKIPLNDTEESKITTITDLNNRDVVVRISINDKLMPAFKARTMEFASAPYERVKLQKVKGKKREEKKSVLFSINTAISLRDLMCLNSTNRKDKYNE